MNAELRSRILGHAPCRIRENVPLAGYTTFKIGGPAALFAEPTTVAELIALLRRIHEHNAPYFYLGLGSNILVSDQGIDGVVIKVHGSLCEIRRHGDVIEAGPGAQLLDLTTFAAVRELSGMEPLSGIPGSVGGGLFMNAGAYGGEISDTLSEVDALTESLDQITLRKDEVGFSYRSAPRLRSLIILHSRYRLSRGLKQSIFGEMRRVWRLRREKQPLDFPSAGSIFKRPPGDYAGRLIEAVGGKGFGIGGAMVSPKHAGIFINAGGATAEDVCNLVREIRRRVYMRFGIMLENEVMAIGFPEDPFAIAV